MIELIDFIKELWINNTLSEFCFKFSASAILVIGGMLLYIYAFVFTVAIITSPIGVPISLIVQYRREKDEKTAHGLSALDYIDS